MLNYAKKAIAVVAAITFSMTMFAQKPGAATDYLHVPGPLKIGNNAYHLAWSSHPAANFYKQEYIAPGDKVERFKTLVSVDVLTGTATPRDLAAAKVEELKKLKASNPIVNYEIYENEGEILLDFLLSANTPDGKKVSIIERNVYRYTALKDNTGTTGVLLLSVAERAYDDNIEAFLKNLKGNRNTLLNAVGNYPVPAVSLTK
ncbi:hypothetical protein [Chitinophaga sp. Cy-1792]|uniref:hypothetical protein n=1 Tax=Chitinophaga sp. Cy-1792 TaxID=2608339 RepID=UPI001421F7C6|nr:hypothetical protein [Chitinophaga sp. Cy-1792]NIG55681.1 hypothetical protein [Chitinophaga sp. Cy-1792]